MATPGNSSGDAWQAEALSQAVIEAIDRLIERQERDDGSLQSLARICQSLATDIVDRASADVMQELLPPLRASSAPTNVDAIIAFKTFVHDVGSGKFGASFYQVLEDQLAELPKSPDAMPVRAQLLSMLALVGYAVPAEQLEREDLLKQTLPLAWLDLAIGQLAPFRLVDAISDLLQTETVQPSDLIPFVPIIATRAGQGALQEIVDEACRFFFRRNRFADADEFVENVELVEPQGWMMPLGVDDAEISRRRPVLAVIKSILEPVNEGFRSAASGLERIRSLFDPMLTAAAVREDGALPDVLIEQMQRTSAGKLLRVAAWLPGWRNEDAEGIDWFQDNAKWPSLGMSKSEFSELAEQIPPPPPDSAEPAGRSRKRSKLQLSAAEAGF